MTTIEKKIMPHELIERNQWVLWNLEKIIDQKTGQQKIDKNTGELLFTKVPYQLNGNKASSTNTKHFASYDDVMWNKDKYSGIGYVLVDDPYTAIDLDDCIINGEITNEAKQIVESLNSFTEISQSGTGLHIFVKGKKPGTRCKNSDKGFEMYDKNRFMVMTGNHLEGTPIEINEAQDAINYLYDIYLSNNTEATEQSIKSDVSKRNELKISPNLTDEQVISIARKAKNKQKFISLYNGDFDSYGSQSEADQALCNILAFYTQDAEQIDRVFSGSMLYREKWDRDDYKTNTIENAIYGLRATYQRLESNAQIMVNGKTVPTGYFINEKEMLFEVKADKDGNEVKNPISRKTPYITKEFHNVEYSQLFYEIEWLDSYGVVKEVVPASTIAKRSEMLELSNKGLSVNENNVRKIIQFMDSYLSCNEIDKYYATERIGKIKGKLIHPLITNNVEIITVDHGEKQLLESFEVKGTVESWKNEVFNCIKDSPKAVFMVIAAFASVVINDLNIDPFLVDLSGTTSQGKTTTLEVASTVWGNRNLVSEWNATKVAIERKAAFLNSFPLFLDDTRKADERILKDIIYQYSGGRSKGRGSIKGSQRELTWQNILLSTGEVSLNEYAKEQGGAAARIIALNGQPLKRDLNNIIELQQAITENYGAIGIEFLNMWTKYKGEVVHQYHNFRSYYVKKSKGNEVLNRIASYYASVHFTASFLKDKLKMDIELDAISVLFDEMAEENKSIDKPMQFLEKILMDLDSDRKSIFYENEPLQRTKALYKNENKQLFLLPAYTDEMLGVEEKQTRAEWLRRGITIPFTRQRNAAAKSKTVDYNVISHRGNKMSAIALNMDVVNELGFDFYKDGIDG